MADFHLPSLLILLLVASGSVTSAAAAAAPPPSPSSLVLSACAGARFPSLCVRTVAPRSPTSLADVALAAVSAADSASSSAAGFLRGVLPPASSPDRAVVRECASLLLHAAEQLARAADQLAPPSPSAVPSQLYNAQTWASAAMTDQDMCVRDVGGIAQPPREAVLRRVTEASQYTSNALYLITCLAGAARGRNR